MSVNEQVLEARFGGERVSLNYRYTAAYNELRTRIAQRQQALQLYVAVVAVVIAALVNVHPRNAQADQAFNQASLEVGPLFLGIPIVSLCFAVLTLKHEMMIYVLRQFLANLERINVLPGEVELISFNAGGKWRKKTLFWRRFYDVAAAILVLASNSFAFYAMSEIYPTQFTVESTLFFVTLIVTFSCVLLVLWPAFTKRYTKERSME